MLHGNRDKLKSDGTLGTYAVITLPYLSSFSLLKIAVWAKKKRASLLFIETDFKVLQLLKLTVGPASPGIPDVPWDPCAPLNETQKE